MIREGTKVNFEKRKIVVKVTKLPRVLIFIIRDFKFEYSNKVSLKEKNRVHNEEIFSTKLSSLIICVLQDIKIQSYGIEPSPCKLFRPLFTILCKISKRLREYTAQ